jgi:ribosomal protein S20
MRQAGEREEHEIRSSAPCANWEKQLLWQVFFRHSRNTDLSMANTAQAKKRARQNEATRKRNTSLRSALRTAVRNVRKAIATGDKAAATKELQAQQSVIDQEDRPQESRGAKQAPTVAGNQGIGVSGSRRKSFRRKSRAPRPALFSFGAAEGG